MKLVEKQCEICGDSFSVVPSRASTAKTCGLECRGKLIGQRYEESRIKLNCKECGVEYSVPACHVERRVYCSMECADKHRADHIGKGESCPSWKGGRTIHGDGYIYLRTQHHPYATLRGSYVFEHRLVMEAALREQDPEHHFMVLLGGEVYLSPDVEVHHIDENKQNNVFGNLLVCTHGAHKAIHDGKFPMVGHVWPEIEGCVQAEPFKIERKCKTCATIFDVKRSDAKRGQGIYCSRECYDARERTSLVIQFSDAKRRQEKQVCD